ncbi:MAG: cytochrome c [bacterium]|nr:cytochrome c [bacterium]
MSKYSPTNSSVFFYVPLVIFAIILIGMIFNWQFAGGVRVGASLPPPVKELDAAKVVNHRALAKDTGLAADGKMLYEINCSSCHGPDGQGNGPRSAGLNPPPRNYKTETFKFGTDVAALHNTLMKGSPGTSMPSFSLLPARDVWAMVHYIRTLIPNPTPTDDAIVAKLPEAPTGADAAAGGVAQAVGTEGRIPIRLAMQQVTDPGLPLGKTTRAYDETTLGAQVYLQKCASCHGKFGEGMESTLIGANPYRYIVTSPLNAYGAPWLADRAAFDHVVLTGPTGRVHPGCGSLTRAQLDALYGFVKQLAVF